MTCEEERNNLRKRAKWTDESYIELTKVVQTTEKLCNNKVDWVMVHQRFSVDYPEFSSHQLKVKYQSHCKQEKIIEVSVPPTNQILQPPTTVRTSMSEKVVPLPDRFQNNSSFSYSDIRLVTLPSAATWTPFTLLEKNIYDELIENKKYYNGDRVRWRSTSGHTGFVDAWIKRCKEEKLKNSSAMVYSRSVEQLKEYKRK